MKDNAKRNEEIVIENNEIEIMKKENNNQYEEIMA